MKKKQKTKKKGERVENIYTYFYLNINDPILEIKKSFKDQKKWVTVRKTAAKRKQKIVIIVIIIMVICKG